MRTLLILLAATMLPTLSHAQPRQSQDWVCARENFVAPCPEDYPMPHRTLNFCFNEQGEYVEKPSTTQSAPKWVNIGAAISTTTVGSGIYLFADKERSLEFLANSECQR